MNKADAIYTLTHDSEGNDKGHLACFSRYGSTSADCAEIAWELAKVWADDDGRIESGPTPEELDGAMSMVVNEADGVATVLAEHHPDPAFRESFREEYLG